MRPLPFKSREPVRRPSSREAKDVARFLASSRSRPVASCRSRDVATSPLRGGTAAMHLAIDFPLLATSRSRDFPISDPRDFAFSRERQNDPYFLTASHAQKHVQFQHKTLQQINFHYIRNTIRPKNQRMPSHRFPARRPGCRQPLSPLRVPVETQPLVSATPLSPVRETPVATTNTPCRRYEKPLSLIRAHVSKQVGNTRTYRSSSTALILSH